MPSSSVGESPLSPNEASTHDAVLDWMLAEIADMTAIDAEDLAQDAVFTELGLSSVMTVEFSEAVKDWTGLDLPPTVAYDHPTIELLSAYVAEELERAGRVLTARSGAREAGA